MSEWQRIETAPKDGKREFLVCLPRQGNVMLIVRYDRVREFFRTKGDRVFLHEGDLWHPLPNPPSIEGADNSLTDPSTMGFPE